MADLVARLRSLANCDARAGEPLGTCMREAADEIEKLRRIVRDHRRVLGYNPSSSKPGDPLHVNELPNL